MAIFEQLKLYIGLLEKLEKTYGPTPKDIVSGKSLTWGEVLKRQRFGPAWDEHPQYLKEEEIIGGINEKYFEIAKDILSNKPQWLETIK